jgi:hypothetical protein
MSMPRSTDDDVCVFSDDDGGDGDDGSDDGEWRYDADLVWIQKECDLSLWMSRWETVREGHEQSWI